MPVKNMIAQWIEDWAWIIEQLPFLLNQDWRGFPKRTPLHSCGKTTHVEHGLGFVICTLIYLVERLHMLQWQQAIETFLGFEVEHDRMCYKTKKINSDGILWSMPLTMVVYCIQNSLPLGWILLLVVTRNSSLAVMSNLPSLINIYFYYSFAWSKFFFSPLDLNYCCAECLPTIIFMVNVVWWIDEYWTLDSWDVPFIGCIC